MAATEIVIVESEYGVTVELRQSQGDSRWFDNYVTEWRLVGNGHWQSQGWHKIFAHELGKWTGSIDLYEAVKRAQSNSSGFKNFVRE